jgi:hypothetical protein
VAVHRWGAGVEHLGVSDWRAYCRDRAAFERVREKAVSRNDPGTDFIFAPVSVAFSSSSVLPDAFALGTLSLSPPCTHAHSESVRCVVSELRVLHTHGRDRRAVV